MAVGQGHKHLRPELHGRQTTVSQDYFGCLSGSIHRKASPNKFRKDTSSRRAREEKWAWVFQGQSFLLDWSPANFRLMSLHPCQSCVLFGYVADDSSQRHCTVSSSNAQHVEFQGKAPLCISKLFSESGSKWKHTLHTKLIETSSQCVCQGAQKDKGWRCKQRGKLAKPARACMLV
eukprot:1156167-Pelagomonas_calceolata.AAC.3